MNRAVERGAAPAGGQELTRSLARALLVLEALGEAGKPLGVTEIARRIDVHKSSVYRLLRTMVGFEYLEQHEGTAAYWLGSRLSYLGNLAGRHMEFLRLARPHVERLGQLTRETANLARLQGNVCVYLLSIPTEQPIGMIARPYGETDPVYSTALGKAMLAFLPAPQVEESLRRVEWRAHTARTVRDKEVLVAQLQQTRARGYAVDDRENDEDVRCVGAPVFGRQGELAGAVSVSAPAFRLDLEEIGKVAALVLGCARDVSTVLGCPRRANPLFEEDD